MAGKFEIYKSDKNNEFYFRLKAANGQVVLASQGYKEKAGAKNGIESVKKNSTVDKNFEKKEAANGKFFFNLKSTNQQVIGASQMYASADGRDKGIEAVKNAADGAEVVDLTV
jgi:uncharacterized protein YegP (UPF0339 family)